MKNKKKKKSFPLVDVKFGVYSFLQGCIVLSSFMLVWKLATFQVDTSSVDDFLKRAQNDLTASIENTATVVSNLVVLVYNMPQMASGTSSVPSFVASYENPSSSTNAFIVKYVHDYSFSDYAGVRRFVCSDVAGFFEVGDLWIDGSSIVAISDKGFYTRSSPWFAKTYKQSRSVSFSSPSSPSRPSATILGDDFRADDYIVKNER